METASGATKWAGVAISAAALFLGIIGGAIGAYGVAQNKEGDRDRRIQVLEQQVKDMKSEQERFISRQEMQQFIINTTESLHQMRDDIRELRKR